MEDDMTIESILVLTGIVLAFGTFAAVLAWADVYTHATRK
jgi:multisubunit Na+/H+ antiporter MnhC subunit